MLPSPQPSSRIAGLPFSTARSSNSSVPLLAIRLPAQKVNIYHELVQIYSHNTVSIKNRRNIEYQGFETTYFTRYNNPTWDY